MAMKQNLFLEYPCNTFELHKSIPLRTGQVNLEHVKSSLDKLSQVVQVKSEICLTQNILDPKIVMDLKYLDPIFATLGLHLGFSAKLKIWQVPACKMEPRSGIISWKNRPPTRPYGFSWTDILCSVPTLVWTTDQITPIGMCGVPSPPASQTS